MRRWRFFSLMFVATILVAVGLLWAARRAGSDAVTLPDGSTVRLLGIAVGSSTFSSEKPWHRIARQVLPAGFQGWLPPSINGSCSDGSNSVTLYFVMTDVMGGQTTTPTWHAYGAEDDAGLPYPAHGGSCSFGSGLIGLTLQSFPRRQSSFRFNFYDQNDRVIGSVRAANPVTGPFPTWSPEPLPQTKTNGPVELTVRGMEERSSHRLHRAIKVVSELSSTDPRWERAKVRFTDFFDATGNRGQRLSSNESAWKIGMKVYRRGVEDFRPDERIRLPNLGIPNAGAFVGLDQTFDRDGVSITVLGLGGPGRLYITNGIQRVMGPPDGRGSGHWSTSDGRTRVESWGSERPFLFVEAKGMEDGDELALVALDDAGRSLKVENSGTHWISGGVRVYLVQILPMSENQSVSVDLALNRPLFFDFFVDPKECKPKPADR